MKTPRSLQVKLWGKQQGGGSYELNFSYQEQEQDCTAVSVKRYLATQP